MFGSFSWNLRVYCVIIAFVVSVTLFPIVNNIAGDHDIETVSEKSDGDFIEIAVPKDEMFFILNPVINETAEPVPSASQPIFESQEPEQNESTAPVLLSPSPEPSVEMTPERTPEPSPIPSPQPSPKPSLEPTPTPSPSVLPSPEPSPAETDGPEPSEDAIYGKNGYMWPTLSTRITSPFGMRDGKLHKGTDIGGVVAGVPNDPIFAAQDGVVIVSFFGVTGSGYGGYGEVVVIEHEDGYQTLYAHCDKRFVKVGDKVKRGDVIAAMGNTGDSFGVHLHFGVMYENNWIDGTSFFPDI